MAWVYNNRGAGPDTLTGSGGYAIADNGVIAGQGNTSGNIGKAFVGISPDWTLIPFSSDTPIGAISPVISNDGIVVGGYQNSDAIGGFPWSWTATGGLVLLDSYGSGYQRSLNCVNSAGTIFAGGWPQASPTDNTSFVTWENGSPQAHGQTNTNTVTVAYCCNAAGTAWGGGKAPYSADSQAWIWTATDGFTLIPFPGGQTSTYCLGMNDDRSLLLIVAYNTVTGAGVYYTYSNGNYTLLSAPDDTSFVFVLFGSNIMSQNGEVVLGTGLNTEQTAYLNWIWQTVTGEIEFLPVPDGSLAEATAISRNGQKIVGTASSNGSNAISEWTQSQSLPTVGPRSSLIV